LTVPRVITMRIRFYSFAMHHGLGSDLPSFAPYQWNGITKSVSGASASLDETTLSVFESAVRQNWKSGVSETNNFEGSRQIKCIGRPWCPRTTEENIASASLMGSVLQSLWRRGWHWHCAIDMSVSVADKSTFFLSRNSQTDTMDAGGHIGCLQPKGSGKVNLVSFPAPILQRVLSLVQSNSWCVPLLKTEQHGPNCATIHFECPTLHRAHRTDDKIKTDLVYTKLLDLVGDSSEGVIFLGSADISGNCASGGENSPPYSLDTDCFFFSFF